MRKLAHLGVILLLSCLLAIGVAYIVGSRSATSIVTTYFDNQGEAYVMYIRDTAYDLRLWLAGTRCFKPLPLRVTTNHEEMINIVVLDTGQGFVLMDKHGADTVMRLRCE